MSEIPPGLKKRWEEFGELSKKCWIKVKAKKLLTEKAFPEFWECMRTGDPVVSKAEIEECTRIGHPLAPHPICVISKIAKDLSAGEAAEECLKEGAVHGISLLSCRAAKRGPL